MGAPSNSNSDRLVTEACIFMIFWYLEPMRTLISHWYKLLENTKQTPNSFLKNIVLGTLDISEFVFCEHTCFNIFEMVNFGILESWQFEKEILEIWNVEIAELWSFEINEWIVNG